MNNQSKQFMNIFLRYLILVLIAIPNFWIFYIIFTPLTIYPVYFILDLFFEVTLSGNLITINEIFPIEIIGACVAGSAYYLLSILNISTPNINFKERIKMLFLAFLTFFTLNIIRIILLSFMFVNSSPYFNITHELFWYAGSVLFVIAIWFVEVKRYNIKDIPFYSDIKFILKFVRKKK